MCQPKDDMCYMCRRSSARELVRCFSCRGGSSGSRPIMGLLIASLLGVIVSATIQPSYAANDRVAQSARPGVADGPSSLAGDGQALPLPSQFRDFYANYADRWRNLYASMFVAGRVNEEFPDGRMIIGKLTYARSQDRKKLLLDLGEQSDVGFQQLVVVANPEKSFLAVSKSEGDPLTVDFVSHGRTTGYSEMEQRISGYARNLQLPFQYYDLSLVDFLKQENPPIIQVVQAENGANGERLVRVTWRKENSESDLNRELKISSVQVNGKPHVWQATEGDFLFEPARLWGVREAEVRWFYTSGEEPFVHTWHVEYTSDSEGRPTPSFIRYSQRDRDESVVLDYEFTVDSWQYSAQPESFFTMSGSGIEDVPLEGWGLPPIFWFANIAGVVCLVTYLVLRRFSTK